MVSLNSSNQSIYYECMSYALFGLMVLFYTVDISPKGLLLPYDGRNSVASRTLKATPMEKRGPDKFIPTSKVQR